MWGWLFPLVISSGLFDGSLKRLDIESVEPMGIQQMMSSGYDRELIKSKLNSNVLEVGKTIDFDEFFSHSTLDIGTLKILNVMEDENWALIFARSVHRSDSIFVMWNKNEVTWSSKMEFEELIRRFIDDEMAKSDTEEKYNEWKQARDQILRPLVDWRNGAQTLEAFRASSRLERLFGGDEPFFVDSDPLIIRIKKLPIMTAQTGRSQPEF